ncbi:F0F1 ATP synthase subunit epsilon [Gammaproteobacteria bacterium]|nr:F0F1 ATP synthase subunit epsilon [Gammaproteobacteria bacterium]
MNTLKISIVSQEKSLFSGIATAVSATGATGELGILPGHTPLLTALSPGQVRVTLESGKEELFWVSGGILEVQPNQVIVLADAADRAADLDEVAVNNARKQAQAQLENAKSKFDHSRASAELAEITAQLKAIERLRSSKQR